MLWNNALVVRTPDHQLRGPGLKSVWSNEYQLMVKCCSLAVVGPYSYKGLRVFFYVLLKILTKASLNTVK